MKRLVVTVLFLSLLIPVSASIAFAADDYFEGWDVPDDLAGWQANTTEDTVVVVNAGGNPGGYLQATRLPAGVFPIGATTELPDASGDYAAAGAFQVSFDVLFDTGTFTSAVFRVRYLDSTFNGWYIPFTSDFTPGVWNSYTIPFDPTWSDAVAMAAGWVQEATSATFAETFANVYHPEIRIDGTGEPLGVCIDNFRIRTCASETPVLNADFNADTPGDPPDLTLPGPPTGDFLALSELSGTVTVAASVGSLTDQPILFDQVPGIGGLDVFAYPATNECGLINVAWNSLSRSNDNFFLACVVRDPSALMLGSVEYRPGGVLTYNSAGVVGPTLPVTYTPDVDQRFEMLVNLTAKTTSLSVDGIPVAGFQNVPFAEAGASGLARLGFEGGGITAQQFAFDNIAMTACDCPCDGETTPPTIDVTLTRDTLWPPNHKLVEICATVTTSDECDPEPVVTLVDITSDEPDNGLGDGDTENDIQGADRGTDDDCFFLRSERQGGGDGRVYTIIYCVTDASGNVACDTATVVVPHDQSGSAFASIGFTQDGTEILPEASEFAFVLRSTESFNVESLKWSRMFIGNDLGVVPATRAEEVYVDSDGLKDLRVFFDAALMEEILLESPEGSSDIAFRYVTEDGVGHLVPNIFGLGPTIESVTGLSPSGAAVSSVLPPQPNPFRSSTEIRYSVAGVQSGRVELAVYDASGRLVRTLFSGIRTPGTYAATWDGRHEDGGRAGSGVYFLKADVGGHQAVNRIVLMR